MARKKKPKLLLVVWRDACSLDGWDPYGDVRALRGAIVNTVGWVVKDHKHVLTLSSSKHVSGLAGSMCIPKGCILSKLVLTPARRSP